MRSLLVPALALAGALAVLPATPSAVQAAPAPRRIAFHEWDRSGQLADGTARGVVVEDGELRFDTRAGVSGSYDTASWKSPWVEPGFTLTELVPSFAGRTPRNSWVKVEVRARSGSRTSTWDSLGRWALDDSNVRRSSPGSQADDLGRVAYDTWLTGGAGAWQIRVVLHRRTGSGARPAVTAVGAMASRLPSVSSVSTSRPGAAPSALGKVLPVPRYSQMVHAGSYPQYDGGGRAWCSPTSTTMVLAYYDALPPASSYRWVKQNHPDRVVVHSARMTYDVGLGGTGNWPFNTAYAASRTGNAFVTRLRSLRQAERYIAAGIPLVASVAFSSGQLDGSPISSTSGHLMVIVGFRENGDVVVNDPAASSRAGVRRTYDRGQFEDAWLKRYSSGGSLKGSGGLVYVIHDSDHPLP